MFSRWHPAWRYLGGSAFLLGVLVALLAGPELFRSGSMKPPLIVFCAVGLREPVTAVAQDFEIATGREVVLRFDGSESLLNQLSLGAAADVYIPADETYLQAMGDSKISFAETVAVARQRAVLVTQSDNPKRIHGWSDLFRTDVKLAQAQPDVAAIGRLTRDHLRKAGLWDRLDRHTLTYLGTVTDVVAAVTLGSVDAGIVWDALALNNPRLRVVPAPEIGGIEARVPAVVLTGSRNQEASTRLLQFLTSPESGRLHFRKHGFALVEER